MSSDRAEQHPLDRLREPFPASVVGKLPRITCPDCSKRSCQKHAKKQCQECGNFISERHMHILYVGHADVTDRLLSVDDEWTWRPLAVDDDGLPRIGKTGADLTLWIELTVAGITRIGVGTCPANQFEADKVLIGDALRNAAMRFGVALDLWSKAELESAMIDEQPEQTPAKAAAKKAAPKKPASAKPDEDTGAYRKLSADEATELVGLFAQLPTEDRAKAKAEFLFEFKIAHPTDLPVAVLEQAKQWITDKAVAGPKVDREPLIAAIVDYLANATEADRAEYEAFLKANDIGFPGDPVEQLSDKNLSAVAAWLNEPG